MDAHRMRHRLIAAMLALITAAVVLTMSAPAQSTGRAEVTWGRFDTFPAGEELGFNIRGVAIVGEEAGESDQSCPFASEHGRHDGIPVDFD